VALMDENKKYKSLAKDMLKYCEMQTGDDYAQSRLEFMREIRKHYNKALTTNGDKDEK